MPLCVSDRELRGGSARALRCRLLSATYGTLSDGTPVAPLIDGTVSKASDPPSYGFSGVVATRLVKRQTD